METAFHDLIDLVDAASDESMIKFALQNFATSCGFSYFAFLEAQGPVLKCFNNYPRSWVSLYMAERYSEIDPVLALGHCRHGPVKWSVASWKARRGSRLRSFQTQAINHGLCSGLTISVEGSYGSRLMLTLTSGSRYPDLPVLPHSKKAEQAVLAIHYRLRALDTELNIDPRMALTPREVQCLRWVAQGKRVEDIAMIAQINKRTVRHYLDNAREKLGAATIPQMIAIAKDHRLV